jgi:lipopolysaccharide export system permease protein
VERRLNAGELRQQAEASAAEARVNPASARRRNTFLMELWLRLAIPFTCLPFALLGAALAARPQGGGMSMALGLSVFTSFLYYTVLRYADIAGREGQLPPVVAAWLPPALALVAGVVMLSRSRS